MATAPVASPAIPCPVCAAPSTQHRFDVTANCDGPLDATFAVHCCPTCGTGFTYPALSGEALSAYYTRGVYTAGGSRFSRLLDPLVGLQQAARLKACQPPGRARSRLLDLGCGKGRFLRDAREHGWHAVGVDPVPGQVVAARRRYGVPAVAADLIRLPFPDEYFDLVTCWHVLEHATDPLGLLGEVRRVLTPGGIFLLEVPNLASWQSRMGGRWWPHLDVPRHPFHYSPASMRMLLERGGFTPVRTSSFSLHAGPQGMIETLLNRLGLPPNWLFRWLKRSLPPQSAVTVLKNCVLTAVCVGPAILLECAAAAMGAGGVVNAVAAKRPDGAGEFSADRS